MRFGAGLPAKSEIRKDSVFPSLEDSPAWTIFGRHHHHRWLKNWRGWLPLSRPSCKKRMSGWSIPTNQGQALERCTVLDGEKGLLRFTTKHSLEFMSLRALLRSKGSFAKVGIEIVAGKAVRPFGEKTHGCPIPYNNADYATKEATQSSSRPSLDSTGEEGRHRWKDDGYIGTRRTPTYRE